MGTLTIISNTCCNCGAYIDVVQDEEREPDWAFACPNPDCNGIDWEPDGAMFWSEAGEREREGLKPKHGSYAWTLQNEAGERIAGGSGQN